jgi:hypothetical protein
LFQIGFLKKLGARSVAWLGVYLLGYFGFSISWMLTPLILSALRYNTHALNTRVHCSVQYSGTMLIASALRYTAHTPSTQIYHSLNIQVHNSSKSVGIFEISLPVLDL